MRAGNCPNCGAPPDGSGRCPYCGTRSGILVEDEATQGAPASYIEITAESIRIGVLPKMEDMVRMQRVERILGD